MGMKLLEATEQYMGRNKLPILREQHFYPTEASVEVKQSDGATKIIGTCARAAYYRYVGGFTGDPFTAYTHWIFLTGKSLEQGIIEDWKQMGLWVDNNVKFYCKEYNVSGEIDVIVRNPDDLDEPIIVELKTYYGYDATKQICGNPKRGIPGQPKDAHLLQLLIYLDQHKHLFKRAKLIYLDKVCKNNAEFDIQLFEQDGKVYPVINGVVQRRFHMQQIYDRYRRLAEYVKNNELPPRDFELKWSPAKVQEEFEKGNVAKTKYEKWQKGKASVGDWSCSYCRYKAECWGLKTETISDEEESETE